MLHCFCALLQHMHVVNNSKFTLSQHFRDSSEQVARAALHAQGAQYRRGAQRAPPAQAAVRTPLFLRPLMGFDWHVMHPKQQCPTHDMRRRLTAAEGGVGGGRVPDEAPEEVNAVIDSCLNTADADSRPSALDLVNFFTVWGSDGEAAAQRSSSLLDVAARRSCSLSSGLSSGEPLSCGRRSISDIGPIPEADPDGAPSRAGAHAGLRGAAAGPSIRSAPQADEGPPDRDGGLAGQAGSNGVLPSLLPAQPVPAVAAEAAHEAARSGIESRAAAGQAADGSGAAAESSLTPPAQRPPLPGRASPFAAAAGG